MLNSSSHRARTRSDATRPSVSSRPPDRCLVGHWTSTEWQISRAGQLGSTRSSGGQRVHLTIEAAGTLHADLNGMTPVRATFTFGGTSGAETLSFRGRYQGVIDTRGGSVFSVDQGPGESTVRTTVRVEVLGTSRTVFEDRPLTSIKPGDEDVSRLFFINRGKYTCARDRLALVSPNGDQTLVSERD